MTEQSGVPDPQVSGSPSRGSMGAVALASLASAVAGYVVMLLAAHILTIEQNAQFLVFWAMLFFVFGILGGIQHETTRSVRSAVVSGGATGARPLPIARAIGAAILVLVLATQWLWATRWFPETAWAVVLAVGVGAVLFAGHSAVAGALAGRGQWNAFALLVGGEAMLRLLLVLVAVLASWYLGGVELASAAGAAMWLLLALTSPKLRSAAGARGDVGARTIMRHALQAMLATAATAALVVGFPVLLRITSTSAAYDLAAPLLLAISFTRAPLMLVVNAFQGVAITTFVADPEGRRGLLLRLLGAVAAVGAVGAGAAAVLGPWLLEVMLTAEYRVGSGVLAVLVIAAAELAVITLTGALALALNRHRLYAAGWVVALAASVAMLVLPGSLTQRAVVSLLVGPAVGAVVHLLGLRRDLGKVPA